MLTATEEYALIVGRMKWRQRTHRKPVRLSRPQVPDEDRGRPYEVTVEDLRLAEIEIASRYVRPAIKKKQDTAVAIALSTQWQYEKEV